MTFIFIAVTDCLAIMPRIIVLLLLSFTVSALCMKMTETVERTVMVRTTGSDLQPAATGYIYKKESDGLASVIKMGESEIMERLTKFYEKPESYKAPLPIAAGPFYAKEEDGDKSASDASQTYVIPVEENNGEVKEDENDGLANDDFKIFLDKYAADFDDYKGFDKHLKDLGYFENGIYHEKASGSDFGSKDHHAHGDKGSEGYGAKHGFNKGGAGDYHKVYHEGYSFSKKGGHGKHYDDADAAGKGYAQDHGYKGGEYGFKNAQSKGEEIDGFHNNYDKNEFKKDHDFYDGEGVEGYFNKFGDGHDYHGSRKEGFSKGGSHDSGFDGSGFGKEGYQNEESGDEHATGHSSEGGKRSTFHHAGEFGGKDGKFDGKSFGYAIKH